MSKYRQNQMKMTMQDEAFSDDVKPDVPKVAPKPNEEGMLVSHGFRANNGTAAGSDYVGADYVDPNAVTPGVTVEGKYERALREGAELSEPKAPEVKPRKYSQRTLDEMQRGQESIADY